VAKYAYSLIVLKRHLKCNFKDAGRAEIEELIRWLNSSEYTAWYKHDLKGILKRFYWWLRTGALGTSSPLSREAISSQVHSLFSINSVITSQPLGVIGG
jgi:hypothetical protein